ncbi:MAG TPA: glycosyltransferase [Methylophaga aminisulfidivorans]|uniref:glycosyltransferase family 4 protein n=1 Tax=Methylophaga TaxID=40222 RepID=UPI00175359CA|nr:MULTISPECIES: glycosyltransferase family 4 protein [Methylophaga]HIC46049.1 glycosyltransferase [Methylophaga sp.]HIM39306.1 glycosyltransferase [Methylophaga aminisulfidivorans]
MRKIYYLIPDLYKKKAFSFKGVLSSLRHGGVRKYLSDCFLRTPKPVGGVKIIYQHCVLLRELGYEAFPLLMGEYEGNFYGYDINTVKYKDVINTIDSTDVVVSTEFEPYQGLLFNQCIKIMFLQNWAGLWSRRKPIDIHKTYIQLGYDIVITCSDFCSNYVREQMQINVKTITNGIDTSLFKPGDSSKKNNRILAMSRKNPNDLHYIKNLLIDTPYEFKIVDGLTQDELIREYQQADIFLATGYPEGFGLPPLEAMCCACIVVGFTGGAASEFMIDNKTALVSKDGDCTKVAQDLRNLLSQPDLKEQIRMQGYNQAREYDLANTKRELSAFYGQLFQNDASHQKNT